MMRLAHSAAGLIATAATLSMLAGCRGTTTEKAPVHINPNMDIQARFDPQEANAMFADGRAMRQPVPGRFGSLSVILRPRSSAEESRDYRYLSKTNSRRKQVQNKGPAIYAGPPRPMLGHPICVVFLENFFGRLKFPWIYYMI